VAFCVFLQPELTTGNFPYYSARGQPFVIVFVNQASNKNGVLLPAVSSVVKGNSVVGNAIYAWMDV
jgi:hypothetical protein